MNFFKRFFQKKGPDTQTISDGDIDKIVDIAKHLSNYHGTLTETPYNRVVLKGNEEIPFPFPDNLHINELVLSDSHGSWGKSIRIGESPLGLRGVQGVSKIEINGNSRAGLFINNDAPLTVETSGDDSYMFMCIYNCPKLHLLTGGKSEVTMTCYANNVSIEGRDDSVVEINLRESLIPCGLSPRSEINALAKYLEKGIKQHPTRVEATLYNRSNVYSIEPWIATRKSELDPRIKVIRY